MISKPITLTDAARILSVSEESIRYMASESVGLSSSNWYEVSLTAEGSKIRARRWGRGFRFLLSGYAADGSDVFKALERARGSK